MRKYLILSIFIVATAFSGSAFAGGFYFGEAGARAMGRATAVVASNPEPSGMFYNPATLADVGGLNIMLGGAGILPLAKYTAADGTVYKGVKRVLPQGHLYISYRAGKKFAFGLGAFAPYTFAIDWDKDFPGRYDTDKASLKIIVLNPTVSYRINKFLAVGAGFQFVIGGVRLQQALGFPGYPDGSADLGAHNALGFGGNMGVLVNLGKKLKIGAAYRSRIKLNFEGNIHYSGVPQSYLSSGAFTDGTGKTTMTLPDVISLGVSYKISKKVEVEADFRYNLWSTFDKLTIELDSRNLIKEQSWWDTFTFCAGVTYKIMKDLELHGGYLIDFTPQPSRNMTPMLPDANRHLFYLGATGMITERLRISGAASFVLFQPRDSAHVMTGQTEPGKYFTMALIAMVSVGYKFF